MTSAPSDPTDGPRQEPGAPTDLRRSIEALLPSSRPAWAMMPSVAATHFSNMLLFVSAALQHVGIEHVIQYGSLLGAARLGAALPWDEDHDLFALDTDLDTLHERLEPILSAHGYRMVRDPRDFWWVRERWWAAASGHLSLAVLPPLEQRVEDLPVWEGGAPHLLVDELRPLRALPFHGGCIWGPAATDAVLERLYGRSGSAEVMSRFIAPPSDPETAAFWARVKTADRLDWPAISERFRRRSRLAPLLAVPWWWFNGGYIVGINALKRRARRWWSDPSS